MPRLEATPGKLTIPGRPEEVQRWRIRGPIGPINYEVGNFNEGNGRAERIQLSVALSRGDRVFRIRNGGLMFVLPEDIIMSGGSESTETVMIPGKRMEVDLSQVEGDYKSGIRFEVRSEEDYPSDLIRSDEVKANIEAGGRVFITEDDDLLFIKPAAESR